MPLFRVTTSAVATEEYTVDAEGPDAAQASIMRGVWQGYRDLGNDDVEIIDVTLIPDETPSAAHA